MVMVLVCFGLGIGAGYLFRSRQRWQKGLNRLTDAVVCLLLFLLGMSMGSNSTIIENLPRLGFQAFILALGAVAGSILAVTPLHRLFGREKS